MTTTTTQPTPLDLKQAVSLEELYGHLAPINMGAGWAKKTPSLWPEPKKTFRPHRWSYAQAKGALDAAGRLINTELAERRNLILQNPGESYATSRTIVAAYQMIMPGVLGEHWHINWYEIGIFMGFVGILIFAVSRTLTQSSLVPNNNLFLKETVIHIS